MQRAQWYKWHSLAGVQLAILVCFILLTGTLAVMSHELDWLTNPAVRAAPHTPDQIAWTEVYRNAQHHTKGAIINAIEAPVHSGFAVAVIAIKADNKRYRLYFDPQSGEFQGSGSWFNWQTVLRRLHRHLMMPLEIGLTIVAASSVLFAMSLVSGLALHRKWFTGLLQQPRDGNRRIFWGDWHRLLGLWSSWLLAIMVVTGLWYLAEHLGLDAPHPAAVHAVSEEANEAIYRPDIDTFAVMLQQVQSQRPNLEIRRIRFPIRKQQTVYVEGQEDDILVRDRANNLVFDPVDGRLLSQRYAADLTLHVRISEAADPLHFGTWGGYPTKILYFVFGIALTAMSITGTYIYAMRVGAKLKPKNASWATYWRNAWRQMGSVKWLSLGLVILSLVLAMVQIT